jgi:hypothetical protein
MFISPEWQLVKAQFLFGEALAARRVGQSFERVLGG